MILKLNKIFIILLISFILLFNFGSNCYASFDFVDSDSNNISLPNLPNLNYDYFLIFKCVSFNTYVLYCSDQPFKYYSGQGDKEDRDYLSFGGNCEFFKLNDISSTSWTSFGAFGNPTFLNDGSFIVYSNHDVYYTDNDSNAGKVFFQKTPIVQESYQIPEIARVTQLPEVIVGVLKMIIPVGLIVLLVVLLIYLIKSAKFRMV